MMEENRLLGNKGEPALEDQEIEPPFHYPSQASRPFLKVMTAIGATILLVSVGGNAFQYWRYRDRTTLNCRSKIGKFEILYHVSWVLLI